MTQPAAPAAKVLRWLPRSAAATPAFAQVRSAASRIVGEDGGATLVEYGMAVALIAIVVMGALYMLGGSISVKLDQIASCLTTHVC